MATITHSGGTDTSGNYFSFGGAGGGGPVWISKAQHAEHDLQQDDRLMKLLETYHPVKLQDEDFPEKLTWCLENCQNKFRDLNIDGYRVWYFENEKDATMFAMKWS
jgi:hypothetical protein